MHPINLQRSTQGLLAFTFLCITLMSVRVVIKDEWRFGFLVWNLFLAWVPFWLTSIAAHLHSRTGSKLLVIPVLSVWLLFFPNAPYIITDLLHIRNYGQNIIWFDSVLIFLFAFTGMIIGVQSLQKAHELFRRQFNAAWAWLLVLGCTLLSGFGIYLGRYCRLNSWDLFHDPFRLAGRVANQLDNPLSLKITLMFGFILFGIYVIFHRFYTPEKGRAVSQQFSNVL